MKSLKIESGPLSGRVLSQPSKSMAHRAILCALLAEGTSVIDNVVLSDDITATIHACRGLGAEITVENSTVYQGRKRVFIQSSGKIQVTSPMIDCHESGSTARFIMPITRLCEEPVTLTGSGRLTTRPFDIYKRLFTEKGIHYSDDSGKMPIHLSGKLLPGEYILEGDVSSQFISGFLFVLPLLAGDSVIRIMGLVESKPYIAMTLDMLKQFGIDIVYEDDYKIFTIRGQQAYKPGNHVVEGDWSQAAFYCVLGAINGNIAIEGLNKDSLQGDQVIVDIIREMGAPIVFKGSTLFIDKADIKAVSVDVAQCPDLVPAISVAAALCHGRSVISNAARLRLKESDRIKSVCEELSKLGALVEELPDGLIINGFKQFKGGKVDGWNDHRIVMALAIASSRCEGVIEIVGYDAVTKSYPEFWDDLKSLGGKIKWEVSGEKN